MKLQPGKKSTAKKLELKRDSLRKLTADVLNGVNGAKRPNTGNSVCNKCTVY